MNSSSAQHTMYTKSINDQKDNQQKEYIFKIIQANTLLHLQIAQKKIDYISERIVNKSRKNIDITLHQQLLNRLNTLEKQCEILQLKLKINEQNYYKQQLMEQIKKQEMTYQLYNDPIYQEKLLDDEMNLTAKKNEAYTLYNQQQNIIKEILVQQKEIEQDKDSLQDINKQIEENIKLQKQKQDLILKEQTINVQLRQQLNKLKNQQCIEDYQELINDIQNDKHIKILNKQLNKGKQQSSLEQDIKYVHFNIYKEKQSITANDKKAVGKIKNALSRNKKRQEYNTQQQQNIEFEEKSRHSSIPSNHITNNSSHFQTLMSSAPRNGSENTFSSQNNNADQPTDNSISKNMNEIDAIINENCISLDNPDVDVNRYEENEVSMPISDQQLQYQEETVINKSVKQLNNYQTLATNDFDVSHQTESQVGFIQSDDGGNEASDDFDE